MHRLTGCCPTRRAAHPVGRGRRLRRAAPLRRGAGHPDRRDQPEPLRRRRLPARQPLPPRPRRAREGARALPRVRRDRRRRSARRRSASGSPTARTTRARTTCAAATRGSSTGSRRSTRLLPAGMRLLVEYKFFEPGFYSTDLPDWGTAALALPAARPAGAGARRHRPPSAGHERRADRRRAARGGPARRLPLQQPQVRRRRPDRRLDRPVRALPDHARDRARGGAETDRVHDRPVAQRRGQDRRDDPVGHEHPDRVREGAARRRASASRARSATATCSARTACCSRRSRPTSGRCSRGCARELGVDADPVAAFRARRLRRARSRASAARRRSRAPTSSCDRGSRVRIALFVTCIGDTLFPEAGTRDGRRCWSGSATRSCSPREQTCCGQMHLNSGYRDEARAARRAGSRGLRRATRWSSRRRRRASGRCASTRSARWRERLRAVRVARRSKLGVEDVGASFPAPRRLPPDLSLAARDAGRRRAAAAAAQRARASSSSSCRAPRSAAASAGRSRSRTPRPRARCSRTSARRSRRPAREVCTALDSSCLLQIGGGLSRRGSPVRDRPPRRDPRVDSDAASRTRRGVELANAQLRTNLRDATDTIRAKRARVVGGAARLGGAARRRPGDQGGRAGQPRRVPAPVRGGGRRRPAATSTGRATRPRRTQIVAEVARAHGVDEVVKVKSLTTDEIGLNEALADGRHPRDRDGLRRADPPARRRLVVAHPRPRDPPQPHARSATSSRGRSRPASAPTTRSDLAEAARALPARALPGCQGRRQRRELRHRRDRHRLRRRVRGERPDVHDAATRSRHGARDREAPAALRRPRGLPAAAAALLDRRADEPVHVAVDRRDRRRRAAGVPRRAARQRPHPRAGATRSARRRCIASAAAPA